MHESRLFAIALTMVMGCTVIAPTMAAKPQPHTLTVGENFVDPIGFYDPSPVFSWQLPVDEDIKAQTAYQIVVRSRSSANAGTSPVWDSGKVDSDQSVWVPYEGPALESRQQVSWRVKIWDDQGRESEWSDQATFEMGLLDRDAWAAHWIELDQGERQPDQVQILKAEFGDRTADPPKVSNVTENLRRAIKRGSTPIRVVTRRLGGDPAPGQDKTLWVDYKINGVRKQVELPQNNSFDPFPAITAHPAYYFRREFAASGQIIQARLYASALGIYEFRINGQRVGSDMLSPGYTMYSKRVESLSYDVTDLIDQGNNAIGAVVGEGWYAGNLLLRKRTELMKLTPKLLAQLELTYADGRVERIVTDNQWRATNEGPIRAAGFYHGEDYDESKRLGTWSQPVFDDSDWMPVKTTGINEGPQVVPKPMPPVRVTQQLHPVKLTEPEPGRYVFDFGQNQVGVPTITMPVNKGETVQIRFAEMLQQDGTLYTENYRTARSQATYVAAETGTVTYTPSLSFFGYRYVELSGLAAGDTLTPDSVIANVMHTDFDSKGRFTSSHDKLNQLQSNIRWGQISNFIDIPTDCPQRDERLGWTGDAQVFLPTSFFNYHVYSFWSRWLQSVRDEQTDDGEIPHTVPSTPFGYSSPGWADVIVTAPWQIYVRTGDLRILADNYQAMQRWVAVYQRRSNGFIPDLTGWGDWLQPYTESDRKGDTAQDLIATAYFGRDARIMQWAAMALGKSDDASRYQRMHDDIRAAFTAKYFPNGVAAPGARTQTATLMGVGYDLIELSLRPQVEKLLLAEFEEADRHLRTGFLGTPLLAPVFDELGHPDISYELLFKESYPSWFFSINQGATTMWERWNSYSHAEGFGDASMNSYNHYAYGAIGQFMYERIAGLSPDPEHPGYKHFFVRPLVGGPLTSARAELETGYGTAVSAWELRDGKLEMEVVVPPNTAATVDFPNGRKSQTLAAGTHQFQLDFQSTGT
ncbi:alfa-L-rhamnosidase [Rhodopirellula maiorica SM1]|uniref:alpha-L-rhamnosidase n=1 Tax=Rhodopirellula maiorica SM1 TaxID=1265738 RepID=M5RNH5_9BACT|nr:glycoside hydrolase family 78 protein [Rhodopirellula maiorica]EMI16937.1 alfa-L-rhamnosidase [Rhodopirellula maiorica SM1]